MKHACPCQSGKPFANCCQPLLTNQIAPATAEQLMRSRYTAYTLLDWKYLYKTWHKTTRPRLAQLRADTPVDWLGLTIVSTEKGQPDDDTGMVEFVATYHDGSHLSQLCERSHFVKENGQWLYRDGV